jgi:hypothetical protein
LRVSREGEMESIVDYNSFYHEWHKAMKSVLTPKEYGEVAIALNDYCFYGIEPKLDGVKNALFIAFTASINKSIKRKIAGRKGGAPMGNKNAGRKNGA